MDFHCIPSEQAGKGVIFKSRLSDCQKPVDKNSRPKSQVYRPSFFLSVDYQRGLCTSPQLKGAWISTHICQCRRGGQLWRLLVIDITVWAPIPSSSVYRWKSVNTTTTREGKKERKKELVLMTAVSICSDVHDDKPRGWTISRLGVKALVLWIAMQDPDLIWFIGDGLTHKHSAETPTCATCTSLI